MPKQVKEYLLENHMNLGWTEPDMVQYLLREKELRVPQHLKLKHWMKLKPAGNTYQHLSNWYQKWSRRLQELQVNPVQALDQFDICVKQYFSAALKEILKQEHTLKQQVGVHARFSLDQKYALLVKEVTVADNVRSLLETTGDTVSSPSSSEGRPPGFHRRTEVRTVEESKESLEKNPLESSKNFPGKCFTCGQQGHKASECPKNKGKVKYKPRRRRSFSGSSQSSKSVSEVSSSSSGSRHRQKGRSSKVSFQDPGKTKAAKDAKSKKTVAEVVPRLLEEDLEDVEDNA